MRLKDAVISAPPQFGLNNNQLQSNFEGIENQIRTSSREQAATKDFRIVEDTATWSSVENSQGNSTTDANVHCINNNLAVPKIDHSNSAESLVDYEGFFEDPSQEHTPSEISDWSEEANLKGSCRGIINPNYPGFQHLGPTLLSDDDLTEIECDYSHEREANEFNNNVENVNHKDQHKFYYEKPKFSIQTVTSLCDSPVPSTEKCINYVKGVENLRNDRRTVINPTDLELDQRAIVSDSIPEETGIEANDLLQDATLLYERTCCEVPVEVEIVELGTSVEKILQFAEIEEICDSSKNSEISETEEILVEQIDLIREAKDLPLNGTKIDTTTETLTSQASDESNTDSEGSDDPTPYKKLEEIDLLSSIGRDIGIDLEKYVQPVPDVVAMDSVTIRNSRGLNGNKQFLKEEFHEDTNKMVESLEAPEIDSKKKEKMARNQARRRQQSHYSNQRRPDKRRADIDNGGFDVYNIETAMPKIDLDAIESHLRAAREAERRENERVAEVVEAVISGREPAAKNPRKEDLLARFDRLIRGEFDESDEQRRNDREEIRRRLAMGPDADDLRNERGRKPSLQSRLQSGMNLQICFMNETASDSESAGFESDGPVTSGPTSMTSKQRMPVRPQVLNLPPLRVETTFATAPMDEADFFARQARLQTEARMALAQAKEMAHMQMEVERQRLKQSPITEMVRSSLEKIGVQLGEERRRLSRVLLTELNVAQLQVLANDLHARIATLNEALVEGLLRRDDLHMEQDSMLVDVEDLTRYLGAKQESLKKRQQQQQQQQQQPTSTSCRGQPQPQKPCSTKPKFINKTLVSLVRK